MILIISLAILTGLFMFLAIKLSDKNMFCDFFFGMLATVFSLGLLISIFAAADAAGESKAFVEEYSYVAGAIEDGETDNLATADALGKKIVDINTEIAKNKARCDNWWDGIFYSKEIAALPYLKVSNTNPWE